MALDPPKFQFEDMSKALDEAYNQRDQGNKVTVGRTVDSGKWGVWVRPLTRPRRSGAVI